MTNIPPRLSELHARRLDRRWRRLCRDGSLHRYGSNRRTGLLRLHHYRGQGGGHHGSRVYGRPRGPYLKALIMAPKHDPAPLSAISRGRQQAGHRRHHVDELPHPPFISPSVQHARPIARALRWNNVTSGEDACAQLRHGQLYSTIFGTHDRTSTSTLVNFLWGLVGAGRGDP